MILNCKLTKLSDDVYEGKHPNGVYEGKTYYGNWLTDYNSLNQIKIDEFNETNIIIINFMKFLKTSTVTKIIEKSDNYLIIKICSHHLPPRLFSKLLLPSDHQDSFT